MDIFAYDSRNDIITSLNESYFIVNVRPSLEYNELEMWANAQRDGRPAEYRWRRLFNAAQFG